jgi:zinc protease
VFLFLFIISGFASANIGQNLKLEVEKYQLPNGLTVLLYEDHSVPLVSYQTWFRVGSKDERPGITGIAHLFEHMMFKGAKRYSGEAFDKLTHANGAVNNAFTSNDYTGYFIDGPSDKLELFMDIESDRMVNLEITDAKIKTEREVVKEERRKRTDNSVMGALWETTFDLVYKAHPYRWPVIGWMADLNRMTVKECNEFYKTFYAPNNAVVVVAGDINKSKVKDLIQKYYGALKASEIKPRKYTPEPNQFGERTRDIAKAVQTPTVGMAFKTSKAGDDDTYVLDLIANILGSDNSSRLYRRMVYRNQIVLNVNASSWTPQEPGFFLITASLRSGMTPENILKVIENELWVLRSKGVTEDELKKAKNQIMMDYVGNLKTIHGKAHALALNETLFSDYTVFFRDLDKYNAVTPEQVLAAAKKYLRPEQKSVIKIIPGSGGQNE